MRQTCYNCKYAIIDFGIEIVDCQKLDNMTEEETEKYYGENNGADCPYYEPYMTEKDIENENKYLTSLL